MFKFNSFPILLSLLILMFSLGHAQETSAPEPYGGNRELKELIKNEMIYPENSLKNEVKGKTTLKFKVDYKAIVSNVRVIQSANEELDKEAARILSKVMWTPSTFLGKPVDSETFLEIEFNPKKYNNYCKSRGYTNLPYPDIPIDTSNHVWEHEKTDVSASPVFSSIDVSLGNFIHNHLKYPEAAFKQNISGTVKLKFVIEPYGRISNLAVVNSVGGGCNEEAIRLARMINWKPAIKSGMAVRSFNSLEIIFDIAKKSVQDASGQGQVH